MPEDGHGNWTWSGSSDRKTGLTRPAPLHPPFFFPVPPSSSRTVAASCNNTPGDSRRPATAPINGPHDGNGDHGDHTVGGSGGGVPPDWNFGDRVLRIVEGGPSENKADGAACLNITFFAAVARRNDGISLTRDRPASNGRAVFGRPLRFLDPVTTSPASFATSSSFGDGFAFSPSLTGYNWDWP